MAWIESNFLGIVCQKQLKLVTRLFSSVTLRVSAWLEFLRTENRPVERDVGPTNVWERGPAPPSPSLFSCPSFSFYHSVKGNTLPQRKGPTFHHCRWQAAPPTLTHSHTHTLPPLATAGPADFTACCFECLRFHSGKVQLWQSIISDPHSSTPQRAHPVLSPLPPLVLKSFQFPSEVSWLTAASVHPPRAPIRSAAPLRHSKMSSVRIIVVVSAQVASRACLAYFSLFGLRKCATFWLTWCDGGGPMQCQQGTKDLQHNQSTWLCLVCARLSLQEGSLLLFWRERACSASSREAFRLIDNRDFLISDSDREGKKTLSTCSDLLPPCMQIIIYICAAWLWL